jgi:hypothetical protein
METGIKPGTEKRVYAALAASATMGVALFAAMSPFYVHLMAEKGGSHAAAVVFWNMGFGAAILAIAMSIGSIWLCRRALAAEKQPILYFAMAESILALVLAAGGLVYMGLVL